jgi:hypothetical protein
MGTVIFWVVEVPFDLIFEGYGEFGWFMFAEFTATIWPERVDRPPC